MARLSSLWPTAPPGRPSTTGNTGKKGHVSTLCGGKLIFDSTGKVGEKFSNVMLQDELVGNLEATGWTGPPKHLLVFKYARIA